MMPVPQQLYCLPETGVSTTREVYQAHLEEKRRRLDSLCEAAKAYLAVEIDAELAELAKPPEPARSIYGPRPTVDDLARATKTVQQMESQIEAIDNMIEQPGIGEAMRPLIEGMMRPMLTAQLEQAEEYRSHIQQALEETPQS